MRNINEGINGTDCLLCPICKNKTRIKLRQDIMLLNFPPFCPKCKKETLVDAQTIKYIYY
ncbi:cysteine-rich KTR domain-containing protein [Listeria ilorinensis]|uniref:cysteine-rich KTR domain-containing protein n=1 Tax=Listeria ilorinensis TaxID=2867439 RepID=UPI003EBF7E62